MKTYTFFYACVPWLKKLHFPWVGPTENIYLAFNWLPTFPLLKKICQSEGGEERERERDIWNDPTSRCASAMIYCEQVVTHTSSNRWGGTRDGKGNKSAAHWGQTAGKLVKNREKSNIWKHWKERKCGKETLRGGRGEETVHSKVWLHSRLSGPKTCLLSAWSLRCYTLVTIASTYVCQRVKWKEKHFTCVISMLWNWLHREQASTLPGIWNNTHGLWPFASHITCMRANNQEFLFVGAAPELPWKSLSGSSTHILSQWKWGETGNIPCGTIGYHRPQRPLPVVRRYEWASKGLHNIHCRGTEIENLGHGFITWMKRTSALEWSITQRQYCSGTMTHFKNDIYKRHLVGNKTNRNFTTLIDTNQRDEVTYVLSNLLFI